MSSSPRFEPKHTDTDTAYNPTCSTFTWHKVEFSQVLQLGIYITLTRARWKGHGHSFKGHLSYGFYSLLFPPLQLAKGKAMNLIKSCSFKTIKWYLVIVSYSWDFAFVPIKTVLRILATTWLITLYPFWAQRLLTFPVHSLTQGRDLVNTSKTFVKNKGWLLLVTCSTVTRTVHVMFFSWEVIIRDTGRSTSETDQRPGARFQGLSIPLPNTPRPQVNVKG